LVQPGATIGVSGFTPAGYPKAVPLALEKRANNGEDLKLTIMTGASVGPEIDEALAKSGAMARRYPYQTNSTLRKHINDGSIKYDDLHLRQSSQQVKEGFLGPVHFAIVEALAITEDGNIIPTTAVGNSNIY